MDPLASRLLHPNQTISSSDAARRRRQLEGEILTPDGARIVMVEGQTIEYLNAGKRAIGYSNSKIPHKCGNQGPNLIASRGRALTAMDLVKHNTTMNTFGEIFEEGDEAVVKLPTMDEIEVQCVAIGEYGGGACTEAAYMAGLYLAGEVEKGNLPSSTRIMGVGVQGKDHVQLLIGHSDSFVKKDPYGIVVVDAWILHGAPQIAQLGNSMSFKVHKGLDFETCVDTSNPGAKSFRVFEYVQDSLNPIHELMQKVESQSTKPALNRLPALDTSDLKARSDEYNFFDGVDDIDAESHRSVTYEANGKSLSFEELDFNPYFTLQQNTLLWDEDRRREQLGRRRPEYRLQGMP